MKKVLKIMGIIFLCIVILIVLLVVGLIIKNHIDSGESQVTKDYYTNFQSDAPLEKKYAGIGSYKISNTVIPSEDDTIGNIRIWYPSELETKDSKYPLIIVTNASNTAALNYESFFERLASWGFIVVGNDDRQSGTGLSTSKTLDDVLNLNSDSNSVFYGKIDDGNIGSVGYSQGGAGTIRSVTEYENSHLFKTIFTGSAAYSLLAQNMGWGYDISKVKIPYFMTAGTGSSDDSGYYEDDQFAGVAPLFSLIDNYNGMDNTIFKLRGRVVGAEHDEMQARTDGYMTAWMLYLLQEDEEASKAFIGDTAEILNNANWQDIEKTNPY